MKHLGDVCKINGAEIEPVDCITAGSPCQDLSVAGKRAGLEGERSGLFMEQIRIIKEMRHADEQRGRTDEFIRPRYMVWENVPGALSSNKGEDFRCVLEETARIIQEDADIPGPPKGGVAIRRMYCGRWVVHCLENTRCTVLGSPPKKKTHRSCRRFWWKKRIRNTLCPQRLVKGY